MNEASRKPAAGVDTRVFESHSETDTARFGQALVTALEPGLVVALIGPLGAGKTRLVQAVATAAGVDRRDVASPTFVLVHEYEGQFPIFHFDTYRLHGSREFLELGAEEYFASRGICFVEWADRVADVLPADHLQIEIAITGDTSREFRVSARGPRSASVLGRLKSPN